MRLFLIFYSVLLLPITDFGQEKDTYPENNRFILIFSPDVNNDKYQQELLLLAKDPIGLDQRNILILEIFPSGGIEANGDSMDESRADNLRKEYGVHPNEFHVILVDKDHKIKLDKRETAGSEEIFKLLE
jgi:hypothetical protein